MSEVTPNARQALYAAYADAFAEIDNVVKNAENPHFGSNYADLGAVLNTIRPVFAKHGLALYQAPGKLVQLTDGLAVSVVSSLIHKGGESMTIETQVPLGKATAQNAVAATTYARRCAAAAIAGIAQVDDDGETAVGRGREEKADSGTVLTKISDATSLDELNALQEEVVATGDEDVVNAFTARRKELKKTKKAKS